jgi:hypothetical protein
MRLAGILQQNQPAPARQLRQFGQRAWLSIEVHRQKRGGAPADARGGIPGIQQQGFRVHVGESRTATRRQHRLRGEGRGQRRQQHFRPAFPQPGRAQRELQRGRAGTYGDGESGSPRLRQLLLDLCAGILAKIFRNNMLNYFRLWLRGARSATILGCE